jgi:uncharacterized protein (DUF1330 family)
MRRSAEEIERLVAKLGSLGSVGIHPTAEQLRALLADEREGLLHYVNLLRFRARAAYPQGHELAGAGLSGADAYARYAAVAVGKVAERGGRLVSLSAVEQCLIGVGPAWDQVAIVEYPSRDAFVDMLQDREYQACTVHRDAGLEYTQLLITRPLLPTG